jgi:heat shock protein HtpX
MVRPSLARRAFVAVAILLGFYLITAAIALALLPIPIVVFLKSDHFRPVPLLAIGACCWIPAYCLLAGLFGVKPRPFQPPGQLLRREDAPSLFAMIDEVARAAKTAPPARVYVSPMPDMFVTETGRGLFGTKSERVLCIGAPYLATFSVAELRAVLAHELGHFAGGDLRLVGVVAFTEGAFRSVLLATETDAFRQGTTHWTIDAGARIAEAIGRGLVKVFAKIYVFLTHPMSRRQELAADVLAAEIAGRDASISALERAHVDHPLYESYLETEVAPAIRGGAMPTDLLEGFTRFRSRLGERGKLAVLEQLVSSEKTDPFDTHPALSDRVAALRALPPAREQVVGAAARTLLDGAFDLDRWLVDATLSKLVSPTAGPVRYMTWRELETQWVPTLLAERGRRTAAQLHPLFPHARTVGEMLAGVVGAFEAGQAHQLVASIEPDVQRQNTVVVGGRTLLALLEATLLERGATIADSLGEDCIVMHWAGETLRPGTIAISSMKDDGARAELRRLVTLLTATPVNAPQLPSRPDALS